MWNGILLFSCNSWCQKAWEVEKNPTISSLEQVKEAICLYTEKKFPTPRPMKLIFISFFSPCSGSVIVHRMCFTRTSCLQLQADFGDTQCLLLEIDYDPGDWKHSCQPLLQSREVPAQEITSSRVSVVAVQHQQEKEDLSGNCTAPAWLSPGRNAGLWPLPTCYSN